jgi:CRP-like cAMP-binding protein
MEKKGELLNQLAIISDLFEKANIETKSQTVILELDEKAFIETFNKIQEKYGRKMEKPDNTFTIRIGVLDIVFNTNNA